jgi:hypothetical protein
MAAGLHGERANHSKIVPIKTNQCQVWNPHIPLRSDLLQSDDFSKLSFMPQMEKKALSAPDEKRSFEKGQLEIVTLGGVRFGRATLTTRVEMVDLRKADRKYQELRGSSPAIPCLWTTQGAYG